MEAKLGRCLFLGALCVTAAGCAKSGEPDGLLVPSAALPPRLDRLLDADEWKDGIGINGEFVIADGSIASGLYPFELRLISNRTWLFAAMEVQAGQNPWSGLSTEGHRRWFPDAVTLFFISGEEKKLTRPSDLKGFLNFRDQGSQTLDGYWTGSSWVVQDVTNASWDNDEPSSGTWGRGGYNETSIWWEIAIPRQPSSPEDGLFLPPGGTFYMATLFSREGGDSPDADGMFGSPHDTFPGEGYTPRAPREDSPWVRFRMAS